jgi:hypothetical protein
MKDFIITSSEYSKNEVMLNQPPLIPLQLYEEENRKCVVDLTDIISAAGVSNFSDTKNIHLFVEEEYPSAKDILLLSFGKKVTDRAGKNADKNNVISSADLAKRSKCQHDVCHKKLCKTAGVVFTRIVMAADPINKNNNKNNNKFTKRVQILLGRETEISKKGRYNFAFGHVESVDEFCYVKCAQRELLEEFKIDIDIQKIHKNGQKNIIKCHEGGILFMVPALLPTKLSLEQSSIKTIISKNNAEDDKTAADNNKKISHCFIRADLLTENIKKIIETKKEKGERIQKFEAEIDDVKWFDLESLKCMDESGQNPESDSKYQQKKVSSFVKSMRSRMIKIAAKMRGGIFK